MKHVSILVPQGTVIIDTIIGTYNLLQMANNHHKRMGWSDDDLYKLDFVSTSLEPYHYNRFISVTPTKTLGDIEKTDLIVIPGVAGNMKKQIELNLDMINWVREQRIQHGAEIASLCRGAFLLAKTGLMKGKTCATHWLTHDTFREMFPDVELLPEKVINEDSGIYSSGGAYSFLNLLLYMVEKFYGRETAIWCSKVSEIEFDRQNQSEFVVFKGQKDHEDEDIREVQLYMETNYAQKISVADLADKTATSGRNFVRRFKKATHNTPMEYIQRVRTEAAKKLLESTTSTIHEVMYDVGYIDDKAFRNVFKRYTGLTPLEYRNKYNREMAFA